ncbi:hypothetical protein ACVJH7_001692 [Bradyrhizobium elkanii]
MLAGLMILLRPTHSEAGSSHEDASGGRSGPHTGTRGDHLRFWRSRRSDQSALLRTEAQRLDQSYSGAARRRRLAYGGGLYQGEGGQYRRLHRHIGPRRNRHDHWALFGDSGFDSDPLHHRSGAAGAALQGGFPGRRHRGDRKAGDEMGRDRARAGAGAARVQPGFPYHAVGAAGTGADRSSARCAIGRDRVRRRDLFTAAGLQADGDAQADREGARDAECRGAAADRGRRRRDQRRCCRAAGRLRRSGQRSRGPDADGVGRHS